MRRRRRWLTGVALVAACALGSVEAVAAGLPTTLDVPTVTVQKAPSRFKFQSRVSQGGIPVGRASFKTVYVSVHDNTSGTTCTEQFTGVEVRSSVMNLTIGAAMNCGAVTTLDEVMRDSNGLTLTVCIESQSSCLQPIDLGSVPFAAKATFAHHATEAEKANVAAQAHYAHRVTADPSILANPSSVGKGYFDFFTPATGGTAISAADFPAYVDGGFMQWSPVRAIPGAGKPATLGICAKEVLSDGTEGLAPLAELLLISQATKMSGSARVGSALDVVGDGTYGGTLKVSKPATFLDTLSVGSDMSVTGKGTLGGNLTVGGDATVAGALSVAQGTTVKARIDPSGNTVIAGTLGVAGATKLADTLEVTKAATIGGNLTVTGSGSVAKGLAVTQGTAATGLTVAGSANVTGGLTVGNRVVAAVASGPYGLSVWDGAEIDGGLTVKNGAARTLDVSGHAAVSDGLEVGQVAAAAALAVTGQTTFIGGVTMGRPVAGNQTLSCKLPASFDLDTTFGVSTAVGATTMTVNSKAVLAGGAELRGTVTTENPIPNVVVPNGVGTTELKNAAVTSAKLAIEPAGPKDPLTGGTLGESPNFWFCSGTATFAVDHPVPGEWQFCALSDVQISQTGGRCKITATKAASGKYLFNVRSSMAATCCGITCF